MDQNPNKHLALLELRCRRATGMVLAGVAFVASYGLIFFKLPDDNSLPFFPIFLALLFYIAGDLLAMIWIRVVASHIREMLLNQLNTINDGDGEDIAPNASVSSAVPDSQVEVVKPGEGGQ